MYSMHTLSCWKESEGGKGYNTCFENLQSAVRVECVEVGRRSLRGRRHSHVLLELADCNHNQDDKIKEMI